MPHAVNIKSSISKWKRKERKKSFEFTKINRTNGHGWVIIMSHRNIEMYRTVPRTHFVAPYKIN